MLPLSDAHRRELEVESAIDPSVIAERGYGTLTAADRSALDALGIRAGGKGSFPGLLLPIYRATGEQIGGQFKPARPATINGRAVKYFSPSGRPSVIDVHPRNTATIRDVSEPLWITEGIKKGDSLTSRGCCVATLAGVFNWRNRLGTLGDWEDIPLKGREVIICFDADARNNPSVAQAMIRLGRWCKSKGARIVRYLTVPKEVNGHEAKGVDDYFAVGGTLDSLLAAATTTEPAITMTADTFSDARLAETIAAEVLTDAFIWCKALGGWLGWRDGRWVLVTEETAADAVRAFCLGRYEEAAKSGNNTAQTGWYQMLRRPRQADVLKLARGIVERFADEFDRHAELLNTPEGVVNLRTGDVGPHDPDLLLTKIARGSFHPGFVHPDVEQALSALPDDARRWFQLRIGQAITGHPTPDGLIVVCQGTGENGKSMLLTDGLLPALGDYGGPASAKLIAGSHEHPTERADLRGQRLLIAEELTEGHALNVTAIKQITDIGQIKARLVHKDNVTFTPSHSLFLTTNYVPTVNETDHGTWRRLALLPFRKTFRKPGAALRAATDHIGDPQLKSRLRSGQHGVHDAMVTWVVEGAIAYYAEGFPNLPASVEDATLDWRKQADRIMAFWDDQLIADEHFGIVTSELLFAFNQFLRASGHHEWTKERFQSRFKQHEITKRHRVEERRLRQLAVDLSRPPGHFDPVGDRPYVYLGIRFRDREHDRDDLAAGGRSEWPDPQVKLLQAGSQEDFTKRSDQSDHVCCKGGGLKPSCKLCQSSPTYWRPTSKLGQRTG